MEFCNFEDSSDLEDIPLLDIERSLILQFCFLDNLIKLFFLIARCSYFYHNWWKERGTKINSSNIFEECYLGKKHSWLLIIWIFKKMNSLKSYKLPSNQNYLLSKTCKKSHSITQTLIDLNTFVFHPNNCLVSLDLTYWESTVAAPTHFFSLAS